MSVSRRPVLGWRAVAIQSLILQHEGFVRDVDVPEPTEGRGRVLAKLAAERAAKEK